MSGVELALAIVPLVIAVIQYREPLGKAGRAVLTSRISSEQRNERTDFYSQLYIELSMLHNTLKKLVGNVRYDDVELLQKCVHQALGTGLQVFEDILRSILQSVDDLVSDKSLGLEGLKLQRTMLARLEYIRRAIQNPETKQSLRERFRLTKNERSQKAAMKKIRAGNNRLFMLIFPLMDINNQTGRKLGRPTRFPPLRKRKTLDPSYKTLAKKWPKGCCSPFKHEAKLSLSSCCNVQRKADEGINMLVSLPDEFGNDPNWQEMRMTALADKTVRFTDDAKAQMAASDKVVRDIDSNSLCSLLHEALDSGADLRIALEKEKLWQLRPGLPTRKVRHQNGFPLRSFLPDSSRSWRLRERSVLAVILAHAVLHCLESPWLSNNWGKDYVIFFREESTSKIEFDRPFLTIDFQEENASPTEINSLSIHSNPTILALGILLLEIHTQTAIESWRLEQHLSHGANPNTDLTTAINFFEEEKGNLRLNYHQAVKECLYWSEVQLDNDELGQKIYEKIVEPLERELSDGFPDKENLRNICGQYTMEGSG